MCAKLFNATMLSSSLFRALKMSACSPAKLVPESAHIAQQVAYCTVILQYGMVRGANQDI